MAETTIKGLTAANAPENSAISLRIGQGGGNGAGLELDTWKSYSFNSHFTTPTDGWSFTLGDEDISDELRIAIAPRQKVTFSISDNVQATGIVDKVVTTSSRGGGTEITVEGRDALSPAVDSVIDPRQRFNAKMNLLDLLRGVFGPFGFPNESQFQIDNDDNRNVMTGDKHGRKTTKKGKPLKSYDLHLLKPNTHEGAFSFAARVANRFGLWIWLSAEGDHLIISQPDFERAPDYRIVHKRGLQGEGRTNTILTATATLDGGSQPSVIYASAFGTGGVNPREQFTLGVVNPFVQTDNSAIFAAYPKTRMLDISFLGAGFSGKTEISTPGGAYVDTNARPLFLHDENSKNQEELESFLKRELAIRMHKSFTYVFEVEGHEYIALDGSRLPWAVDTIVTVDDDICDVHRDLWILSRTFTKSRSGGTKTKLECIVPHSLEF